MSNKKLIVCFAAAVVGLVCLLIGLFSAFQRTSDYFVRVDNNCVREIAPRGGMDHTYTLPAYHSSGAEKEIVFDTSRLLRDGAYLRLKYNLVRGVVSWEEVTLDEIPEAIRGKLQSQ